MRDKMDYLGYSLEEAYFHKKNEEILKKLREKKGVTPEKNADLSQQEKSEEDGQKKAG